MAHRQPASNATCQRGDLGEAEADIAIDQEFRVAMLGAELVEQHGQRRRRLAEDWKANAVAFDEAGFEGHAGRSDALQDCNQPLVEFAQHRQPFPVWQAA